MSSDKVATQLVEDTEALDPALVEAYLRDHPGFFRNRPDLLSALQLPHGGEGAVSLVERQVSLLRERNIDMRKRLAAVSDNAERNDKLFIATRDLVLKLIEATSIADMEQTFTRAMADDFDVSMSCLLWLPEAEGRIQSAEPASAERAAPISALVRHGHSLCGVLRGEEMSALFKGHVAEGSAAVAPLMHDGQLLGVVAVGDRNVERYQAADGTMFLDYLAEVIIRLATAHNAKLQ